MGSLHLQFSKYVGICIKITSGRKKNLNSVFVGKERPGLQGQGKITFHFIPFFKGHLGGSVG